MIVNSRGGILHNAGFVWLMAVALSIACGADVQAAPAKTGKQSSTRPIVKQDPGEWAKVVEAAKKEGKIVISASPGEGWRKSLVDMFQQEYPEITVEFSAASGRTFGTRIRQERELGKKLWDMLVGGSNTALEAKNNGYLVPIGPLLRPEIADASKWLGGLDGMFIDKENKYVFAFILFIQPTTYANRDFIKESDLKSTEQLLDPKFKGKIVITTPTAGSSYNSLSHLAFAYGKNFLRDLLSRQEVIITDDDRQQVEWVVRGKYPIAIGFTRTLLIPYEKQGLGKNIMGVEDRITKITSDSGNISIFEGAPHPNAIKVYLNWLLSQKTQTMLTKNVEHNSSRTDVPPVELAVDPAKLSKYRNVNTEESNDYAATLLPVIKEALKK